MFRSTLPSGIARWIHRGVLSLTLLVGVGLTALMAAGSQTDASPRLQPPSDSPSATPVLTEARQTASELKQLHSLLVSWRGDLILEHYATGVTAGTLANIKSASKSVIAAGGYRHRPGPHLVGQRAHWDVLSGAPAGW